MNLPARRKGTEYDHSTFRIRIGVKTVVSRYRAAWANQSNQVAIQLFIHQNPHLIVGGYKTANCFCTFAFFLQVTREVTLT